MDANREALAFGGFHGGGVQTFLAWLAARVELKDGDKQPEPRVLDEDAIVLTTWHASKGREWPVVAVCGLDQEVKASCRTSGSATGRSRTSRAARGRADRVRPAFAAPETERAVSRGAASRWRARKRGGSCTWRSPARATSWCSSGREYLAGKDKVTYWSILAEECQVSLAKRR
jgi:ATP-dependent helicase/nuclease subunit A